MPTLETRDPAEDLRAQALEASPLILGACPGVLAELSGQSPEEDLIRELDAELDCT